eukprot:COSAG04_NODE_3285_length_2973_cov_3.607168_4_plen_79_part_00
MELARAEIVAGEATELSTLSQRGAGLTSLIWGQLDRPCVATLDLMRAHIAAHGEDAWRSVAGAGYSMPHQMRGRPRGL